jgi:hypothetical protein
MLLTPRRHLLPKWSRLSSDYIVRLMVVFWQSKTGAKGLAPASGCGCVVGHHGNGQTSTVIMLTYLRGALRFARAQTTARTWRLPNRPQLQLRDRWFERHNWRVSRQRDEAILPSRTLAGTKHLADVSHRKQNKLSIRAWRYMPG